MCFILKQKLKLSLWKSLLATKSEFGIFGKNTFMY